MGCKWNIIWLNHKTHVLYTKPHQSRNQPPTGKLSHYSQTDSCEEKKIHWNIYSDTPTSVTKTNLSKCLELTVNSCIEKVGNIFRTNWTHKDAVKHNQSKGDRRPPFYLMERTRPPDNIWSKTLWLAPGRRFEILSNRNKAPSIDMSIQIVEDNIGQAMTDTDYSHRLSQQQLGIAWWPDSRLQSWNIKNWN